MHWQKVDFALSVSILGALTKQSILLFALYISEKGLGWS